MKCVVHVCHSRHLIIHLQKCRGSPFACAEAGLEQAVKKLVEPGATLFSIVPGIDN